MKDPKLQELKESLAKLDTKWKEISANGEDEYSQKLNQMGNYFYDMINGVRQYLYRLEDRLYVHETEGHIPKIVGAERMNNALEVLGLDGDFEAKPKIVYASRGNYIIEAECPEFKK